jgi:hypothetical protein
MKPPDRHFDPNPALVQRQHFERGRRCIDPILPSIDGEGDVLVDEA